MNFDERTGFSGAKKEGRCWRPSSFGCFKFILSRVEVKLLRAAGIRKTCDILYSFESGANRGAPVLEFILLRVRALSPRARYVTEI